MQETSQRCGAPWRRGNFILDSAPFCLTTTLISRVSKPKSAPCSGQHSPTSFQAIRGTRFPVSRQIIQALQSMTKQTRLPLGLLRLPAQKRRNVQIIFRDFRRRFAYVLGHLMHYVPGRLQQLFLYG